MFPLWRSLALKLLRYFIANKFPTVHWITTRELADWLNQPTEPQPILLDARNEAEYAVSHLLQAQRIDPYYSPIAENVYQEGQGEFVLPQNRLGAEGAAISPKAELLAPLSKDCPIVVYCSVGYRSARVAAKLGEAGFSQVYNLEGSLFQWANEGRPLFQQGNPVRMVHPYSDRWGKLLRPQYRAEISRATN